MSQWPLAIRDNRVTPSDHQNFLRGPSPFLLTSSSTLSSSTVVISKRYRASSVNEWVFHWRTRTLLAGSIILKRFLLEAKGNWQKTFELMARAQLYTRSLFVRTKRKKSGDGKLCHPGPSISAPVTAFRCYSRSYFYSFLLFRALLPLPL